MREDEAISCFFKKMEIAAAPAGPRNDQTETFVIQSSNYHLSSAAVENKKPHRAWRDGGVFWSPRQGLNL